MNAAMGLLMRGVTPLLNAMPAHAKRMTFLVSFFARLNGKDELEPEVLAKLNEVMDLVSDRSDAGNALQVPNLLNKVIWQGKPIQELADRVACEKNICEEKAVELDEKAKDAVPGWMQYQGMSKDLALLLAKKEQILGA